VTNDTISLADRMSQHVSDDKFREHSTRTAFHLALTPAQVDGLLALDAGKRLIPKNTFLSLNAKGLTAPLHGRSAHLTAAGCHVVGLLKIAGFVCTSEVG
jgi:hypothetical protein